MAARSELRLICKELEIEDEDLSIEEMKEKIKEIFDKKYNKNKYPVSADQFSSTLLKFVTLEYDYVIEDKNKKELDYNLKEK